MLEVDDADASPPARRFRLPPGQAEVLADRSTLTREYLAAYVGA